MKQIEVVLSMPLFHHRVVRKNTIVVVIDILRSTTSIISALDAGVKSIIPVSSSSEAEVMKDDGYLLAAEENGVKLSIADYGISADQFWIPEVAGKEIVYSTTNCTKAFRLAREESEKVVIGAFPNLSSIADYLIKQNKNINLVCAGSDNMPALEDQLFAGALGKKLMDSNTFSNDCDSLTASIDIWDLAKDNLFDYAKKLSHMKKYVKTHSTKVIEYTFTPDTSKTIPVLHFNHITAMK